MGARLRAPIQRSLLIKYPIINILLLQYPPKYQVILGPDILGNEETDEIHDILIKGKLYTGINASKKIALAHTHMELLTTERQLRFGEV